jgi:hypothetical protein
LADMGTVLCLSCRSVPDTLVLGCGWRLSTGAGPGVSADRARIAGPGCFVEGTLVGSGGSGGTLEADSDLVGLWPSSIQVLVKSA